MALTRPATIRRYRRERRSIMRGWRQKMRQAERVQCTVWLSRRTAEQIAARATQLEVFRRSIMIAALEYGLRSLPVSEIIRVQREWMELAPLPHGPVWPGAPHDKNDPQYFVKWKRRRSLLKEAANG